MPTYEYRCKKCGKVFEYKQSMKDEPLSVCPEEICEHSARGEVERLLSGNVGVVFKGSGFYETDYKNKPAATGTDSGCAGGGCCCGG